MPSVLKTRRSQTYKKYYRTYPAGKKNSGS